MKLLDLFKKQKTRFITKELISLSSLAQIPSLDYFKDNSQFLALINLKKQEYLETLIKEKVLTSNELKSDELHNKLKMIYSLIEQNTLGDELFEKVIFDEEDKVKALVKIRKFAIYNEKINDLEEEIVSRIIALKEILKKTFLNKQKRISIINEINNLTNIFVILMNQKETLRLCLNNYGLKCFDITKEKDLEKEDKLISKRKEELNAYQMQVFGKIIYQLNDLKDMAKVEVALEDYVYNSNENAKKLKEELNNINSLEEIEKLEKKYYLYYEFGKNLVTINELKELYTIKFKILTNGLVGTIQPFILYRNIEKQELEVYKEIISQKINALLKGNNEYLKEIFKKDYPKALLEITKQLKSRNEYNPESILRNRYQLNLLLATEVDNGISLFFTNYKIYATDYEELQIYRSVFDWEKEIPLETIFRLEKINKIKNRPLLYDLYVKNNPVFKENYYLFNGVKGIKSRETYGWTTEYLLKAIKKEATGKNVIMPNSLKKYEFNLFKDTIIKGIIFPEGFAELNNEVLANNKLTYVSLPSTFTTIKGIVYGYIDTIVFTNFRKSNILWNENSLNNFFKGLIDTGVLVKTDNGNVFKNILKFNRIILLDDDKKIEISSKELECEYIIFKDNPDVTIKKVQNLFQEKIKTQNKEAKLILSKRN